MKPASQTQLENLVPSCAEVAPLLEEHRHPSLIPPTREVWQAFHPNGIPLANQVKS